MAVARADEAEGVSAVMPLRPSAAGGSGSFLVLADDGQRYWCKSLNNFQGERVPVTEQIVARLGSRIGAPACEARLVDLTDIAGWEFRAGAGRVVEPGWAHGSLAVEPALETRGLDYRGDDDNRRRHCGIYALCDWLAGGDLQWLLSVEEDNAYYSHDHGFFLTGPDWTIATLGAAHTASFALSEPGDRLDADELERLADALEALTREDIEVELSKLPSEWPVTDEELDAVADFAHSRRGAVTGRLRSALA
ncbi:MAG: hypothetical protein ACR2HC_06735 [Thermoleophilaceae bacterium]